MADEQVLAVQKWVNATYGSVKGYVKCAEDGVTGWKTIYSLRMGLQHEGGISPVQNGFGDATRAVAYEVAKKLKIGYKDNTVKLIKGAFWCKGISPTDFTNEYTQATVDAIKTLQGDAGVKADGFPNIDLMAALFDMSAFVLVPGGDSRVREMQQWLNANFEDYIGIRPCDGIYQRDTNEALIYALQATGGMALGTANGFYGPGTITLTPTFDVNTAAVNKWATILKYALYVNGYAPTDWSKRYDASTGALVVSFRRFMKLPPYETKVDLTVFKGLLTSNGNTNRSTNAFDTATRLLNDATITKLRSAGYDTVGRYLTGTVGSAHADKSLSVEEMQKLTNAGFSVFPIYEDGGYQVGYFSSSQGSADGFTASNAARKLGFPSGTTIYFAADVDLTGDQIESLLMPYLKSVKAVLDTTGYTVGVYATRNACLHAESLGITDFFVANMSSGWSGNLGFKMPSTWCFDQYNEDTTLNIDLDGYSGRDTGLLNYKSPSVTTSSAIKALTGLTDFKLEEEKTIMTNEWLTLKLKASTTFSAPGSSHSITIKNGKFDSTSLTGFLTAAGLSGISGSIIDATINKAGVFALKSKIKDGKMSLSVDVKSTGEAVATLSFTVWELDEGQLDQNLVIAFEATFKYKEYLKATTDQTDEVINTLSLAVIAAYAIAGVIAAVSAAGPILATAGASAMLAAVVAAVSNLSA